MFQLIRTILCVVLWTCACTINASDTGARVQRSGTQWVIENAKLRRVVETTPFLRTVGVRNKTTEPLHDYGIESENFRLGLDGGELHLTAVDFAVGEPRETENKTGARLVVPLHCQQHGIRVNVEYRLGTSRFYLHKQLDIDPGKHHLDWVDVERMRLGDLPITRFDQEGAPYLRATSAYGGMLQLRAGRPLFAGREVFLGVEHPASINSVDDGGWINLRQHPGCAARFVTEPAVIGVCPDRPRERLLDQFEVYIDENRDRAIQRFLTWVVYFEGSGAYDPAVTDELCRQKFELAEKVFRKRGVKIDSVVYSGTWSDPQSIMAINPQRPERMRLVAKLCQKHLGAKLGLHVITSGKKAWVDKDWLAAEGYDMIWHGSRSDGAYCLADPRVHEQLQNNLLRYVRQFGCGAYYYDWAWYKCDAEGHRGHQAGEPYGTEAIATRYLQMMRALREADSEIFLYNCGWFSPWLLWHYDAIFCGGGDYGYALAGPPSYSTASLLCSWRDETIHGNVVGWSPYFPLNSVMSADPISYQWFHWDIHSESPVRAVTDHFVTSALRGGQVQDLHSNISAWSDEHSDAVAAVLRWMRANDDILLAHARMIGGSPLVGEPYGYAHFKRDNRGLVMVRNPSVEPHQIEILLDETAGMWPSDQEYVVRCIYPFTDVLPETVHYGEALPQSLGGEEVRVLEIWPLDALPEPMPVGCRYQTTQRDANQTTFQLATADDKVEVLSPVALREATPVPGKPHRYVVDLAGVSPAVESLSVEFEPRVENGQYVVPLAIPEGAESRMSFLFKQSGMQGELVVNGKPVEADAPHVRLADSQGRTDGLQAGARNWSLFGVDLESGQHEVRFTPSTAVAEYGVLVVVDARAQLLSRRTVSFSHAAVTRVNEPQLPQNWAWQDRRALGKAVGRIEMGEKGYSVDYYAENEPAELPPIDGDASLEPDVYQQDSLPLVLTESAGLELGAGRYLLEKEGLYRIRDVASSKVTGQAILYRDDIWRLAGHLSRLSVFGNRDRGGNLDQWNQQASKGEPVSLLCSNTNRFVLEHLKALGIRARQVQAVAKGNWNQFADGHVVMEIFDPETDRWVLFDPALGTRLRHQGRLLSLLEATQLYRADRHPEEIEFVSEHSKLDPQFNYQQWVAKYIADGETASQTVEHVKAYCRNDVDAIQREYDHFIEIPIIEGCFVVASDSEEELFRSLWPNHQRLTVDEFQKRFYGTGGQ